MDEPNTQPGGSERPITAADGRTLVGTAHLDDPRALQILTTEHWSQLTARSLVYNEAVARAGMFLTFLTGTLVALGFVSQGSGYGSKFLLVATVLLGFDLFIGLAMLGRITPASSEEVRAVQGMHRVRHAYLEMVPTLEPYISASWTDDLPGVLAIYGAALDRPSPLGNFSHGLTTPGMIGMIIAVVGGAFIAAPALLLGAVPLVAIAVGVVGFVILTVVMMTGLRQFRAIERNMEVRFPPPPPRA